VGSGIALAGPAALAPAPVWQVDTGVADWLGPAPIGVHAPAVSIAGVKPAEPGERLAAAQLLARVANGLRDIRYRRGGRSPTTGFDCSGFVRYVFQHGIGAELPNTSAAQFRSGQAVARDQLRSG